MERKRNQMPACAACKLSEHCQSVSCSVPRRALFFGYGLPLIILVSVLMIVLVLTKSEAVAALSSLGALALYYLLLWLKVIRY